jgi:hypothetical protein
MPLSVKTDIEQCEKTHQSIMKKICVSYQSYRESLIQYCQKYSIPIIYWEKLMEDVSCVNLELNKLNQFEIDVDKLVNVIIKSRKKIKKGTTKGVSYSIDKNELTMTKNNSKNKYFPIF